MNFGIIFNRLYPSEIISFFYDLPVRTKDLRSTIWTISSDWRVPRNYKIGNTTLDKAKIEHQFQTFRVFVIQYTLKLMI